MKQSNATQQAVVEHPVAERLSTASDVHAAYIGLDVHKASISVAIAEAGRQAPEFRGEIPNEPQAIDKLVRQLSQRFDGQPLLFSYEAGPCGYGVYHQVQANGHDCEVVAPTLIPRSLSDLTDRRDIALQTAVDTDGVLASQSTLGVCSADAHRTVVGHGPVAVTPMVDLAATDPVDVAPHLLGSEVISKGSN